MAHVPASPAPNRGVKLVICACGALELPALILNDRGDGGHLVVQPPRPVWDRTALTPLELAAFSYLVAAAAAAMLRALPQLDGGCINYWDAGNWALNPEAQPIGPKRGPEARELHLHLFGRSRSARNPNWMWGEAPRFPSYLERLDWAGGLKPLSSDECALVASTTVEILRARYSIEARTQAG